MKLINCFLVITAFYGLDTELEPEPEPEPKLDKSQNRNRTVTCQKSGLEP